MQIQDKAKIYADRSADIVFEAAQHFMNSGSNLLEIAKPILVQVVGEIAPNVSGLGDTVSVVDDILAFQYPSYISEKYSRDNLEDKNAMDKYKKQYLDADPSHVNHLDEMTGDRNMTRSKKESDKRRTTDVKYKHNAETDHIVPLHEIHSVYGRNIALSDSELKKIANADTNFAVTINGVNNTKRDMSYREWLEENENRRKEGKYYVPLTESQKRDILKIDKEARVALQRDANKEVLRTITGKNGISRSMDVARYSLLQSGKKKLNQFVCRLVIELLKPTFHEIRDLAMNGLNSSLFKDMRQRICRIGLYVRDEAMRLAQKIKITWDIAFSIVGEALSSIAELFYGFAKHIVKLLRKGVEKAVYVWKLYHDNNNGLSRSQKADAAMKSLGQLVIDTCGLGLEQAFLRLRMPAKSARSVSVVVSGLGTILLFHAIESHDILGYKEEEAIEGVRNVFARNIRDLMQIELAYLSLERTIWMSTRWFSSNHRSLSQAVKNDDYSAALELVTARAARMGVDLSESVSRTVKRTKWRGLPA